MNKILWVLILVGVITLSLPPEFVQAAPVPLLKIDGPMDGQVIDSFVVDLNFALKNFTLKDFKQLLKNNPNQGHLHIWLDQDSPTKDNAIMYYKSSPYTFADVPSGKHTLIVELVNNDHTSFDPQIVQTIKFETKAPAGSEAAPVKPSDTPKVATSKSGGAPVDPVALSSSSGGYVLYLGTGIGALIIGLLGVLLLRR
jgi:hypothetical protein